MFFFYSKNALTYYNAGVVVVQGAPKKRAKCPQFSKADFCHIVYFKIKIV
jgi:hypothetical protein